MVGSLWNNMGVMLAAGVQAQQQMARDALSNFYQAAEGSLRTLRARSKILRGDHKMKKETLLELAEKWELNAKEPEFMDGSPGADVRTAAQAKGRREGLFECADQLRGLISILG